MTPHPVHTASVGTAQPDASRPSTLWSGERLLQPSVTCSRLERASRCAPIVDAADYFAHLRDALLRADHSVMFVGWEFDARLKLDPDHPLPGVPQRLGRLLSWLMARKPGLKIRVLQWNLGVLGTIAHGTTPLHLLNLIAARRFDFRLDSAHPLGGSQHQKIVVIDDALAFCGGIDVTAKRWDNRRHLDDEVRRLEPSGRRYGPFHDVTVAVDGAAAAALGDVARERWARATGERLTPPPPAIGDPWPQGLAPLLRDIEVGVARTDPAFRDRPAVREVEELYLAAIAAARHAIYIESQYFTSRCIALAVAERLAEPDGPEIVVVNPLRAMGWLEEFAMGDARLRALAHIAAADRHGRFRIYRPVTESGRPIYVHAKVLIVDDRLLRIGSSNLNNRSMGLDAECDVAVEATDTDQNAGTTRTAIASLRHTLLAEHLGVAPETFAGATMSTGSLIAAIEQFRRPEGRTLMPLDGPSSAEAHSLGAGELLDPEHPEPVWKAILHNFQDSLRRRKRL